MMKTTKSKGRAAPPKAREVCFPRHIGCNVSDELYGRLADSAHQDKVSISDVIRAALEAYLQ